MKNLTYSSKIISWNCGRCTNKIELSDIFFASYNEKTKLIYAETEQNFIKQGVLYFDLDGNTVMNYNFETGEINWMHHEISNHLKFDELIQVGYFPLKNLLLIMLNKSKRDVIALDLDGEYLYEVEKPIDFEMLYFQEFPDYIAIVCEGNKNQEDKYGRNRFNFKLNQDTGILDKEDLAY
ncbi:hypothetical protein [Enterococcus sp. AZ192]|uniref:hypothetical protein n=1 Tax=unclassified Enterococcus TaxID=2608891 RepID=UPI003D2E6706